MGLGLIRLGIFLVVIFGVAYYAGPIVVEHLGIGQTSANIQGSTTHTINASQATVLLGVGTTYNKELERWENATHFLDNAGVIHLKSVAEPKTQIVSENGDIYGVPKLGTLAMDAGSYSALIAQLKAAYPGYTVKVYDGGRYRIATESWGRSLFAAIEAFAQTGKHADDWNSQTRKGELDTATALYLFKANGDGWDLVFPVTMSSDDTKVKVFEMSARSGNLDNPVDITPAANTQPQQNTETKTGTQYKNAESSNVIPQIGADKFGGSSTESAPSGADKFG